MELQSWRVRRSGDRGKGPKGRSPGHRLYRGYRVRAPCRGETGHPPHRSWFVALELLAPAVGSHVVSRCPRSQTDGPRSGRSSRDEVRALAEGNVLHGLERHEGLGQEDRDQRRLRDCHLPRDARTVAGTDVEQPQLVLTARWWEGGGEGHH